MKKRELSIDRITKISNGLNMVMAIDDLPSGVTIMRLGNFAEEIRTYVTGYNKAVEIERKKALKKQAELDRKIDGWQEKYKLIDIEFDEKVQEIKENINTEKKGKSLNCPEFKLSEFLAQEDFTRVLSLGNGQTQEVKIKKGQSLMPIAFYTNMGDLISE